MRRCKFVDCATMTRHLGRVENTLERIKRYYWFAGMRRFVTKYVNACLNCAYYKHNIGKRQCKLNKVRKMPVPFHTLHIDHIGLFKTSQKRNKFLLVVVDAFTKFTVIEPVKSKKTCYVKVLLNFSYLFGVSTRIISDRETAFTSRTFCTFRSTHGIKHVLNAVATSRANGQCEQYNKTIVQDLAKIAAGRDWYVTVKQKVRRTPCTTKASTPHR